MSSLREKLKKFRRKPVDKESMKVLFIGKFASQAAIIFVILQFFVALIARLFYVSDSEFISGIQSVDVGLYVLVAAALFGFLRVNKDVSLNVALAGFYAIVMVTTVQFFKVLTPDFNIPDQDDGMLKQSFIFAPLTFLFTSAVGVAWNLVCVIWKSLDCDSEGCEVNNGAAIVTQDQSIKTENVRSSLAQDLRLSRSHARRRHGGRSN